jgi:hypothetical protein
LTSEILKPIGCRYKTGLAEDPLSYSAGTFAGVEKAYESFYTKYFKTDTSKG